METDGDTTAQHGSVLFFLVSDFLCDVHQNEFLSIGRMVADGKESFLMAQDERLAKRIIDHEWYARIQLRCQGSQFTNQSPQYQIHEVLLAALRHAERHKAMICAASECDRYEEFCRILGQDLFRSERVVGHPAHRLMQALPFQRFEKQPHAGCHLNSKSTFGIEVRREADGLENWYAQAVSRVPSPQNQTDYTGYPGYCTSKL